MHDNVMAFSGGSGAYGKPAPQPQLAPNEVSAVPNSDPTPRPQPRPNFTPEQQQGQMSEAVQQAAADKIIEHIPQMPSFPGIVGVIDRIGRALPWYVWLGVGAFLWRTFTNYMRK